MAKKTDNQERQLRTIQITAKGDVKMKFEEVIITEPKDGEEESSVIANKYTVESPLKPHRDLLDAMRKLRKHASDICEMSLDVKALSPWTVSRIDIAGNLFQRQSRAILTMAKEIKRTGKIVYLKSPQVTMYGESEYERAQEMSKLIEVIIDEANQYLEGKGEAENQLPLFPKIELQTA